jgi:hypothetical protein
MKKTLFFVLFTVFSSFLMAQNSISFGRNIDNNSDLRYYTLGILAQKDGHTDIGIDFGYAKDPYIEIVKHVLFQFNANYYFSKEKRRMFVGMKLVSTFHSVSGNDNFIFTEIDTPVNNISNSKFNSGIITIFGASFNVGYKFRLSKRLDFLAMYSKGLKTTNTSRFAFFDGNSNLSTFDFKLLYKLKN